VLQSGGGSPGTATTAARRDWYLPGVHEHSRRQWAGPHPCTIAPDARHHQTQYACACRPRPWTIRSAEPLSYLGAGIANSADFEQTMIRSIGCLPGVRVRMDTETKVTRPTCEKPELGK
jgi:hypothetical protein